MADKSDTLSPRGSRVALWARVIEEAQSPLAVAEMIVRALEEAQEQGRKSDG